VHWKTDEGKVFASVSFMQVVPAAADEQNEHLTPSSLDFKQEAWFLE
jgi:hypothetical protein